MTFLQLSMNWPYSGLFGPYDFINEKRWCHMNFYFQLILKSPIKFENLDFSNSSLCLAFKKLFGLFSIFLAFRSIKYSKSFKFELYSVSFQKMILLSLVILWPFLVIFLPNSYSTFTKLRLKRSFWGADQVLILIGTNFIT